jgi:hypothetical protein
VIALDCVRPGDPDPTYGDSDAPGVCPWIYEDGSDEWWCTRMGDHPGPHIAGDGVEVLAVWS